MRNALAALALLLSLSGCSVSSPEELSRLMKEDPQFKQMVVTRDQVHAEVQLIKRDLLDKKKTMDAEIGRLREAYDAYAKAQNVKIEKYEAAIEADRARLRREIEAANAQLAAKTAELEGYQKTLSDVKKMLKESKGISLSAQEKQKWEERILLLSEKIRPLQEECQELKLQIRLKKQKISFLK